MRGSVGVSGLVGTIANCGLDELLCTIANVSGSATGVICNGGLDELVCTIANVSGTATVVICNGVAAAGTELCMEESTTKGRCEVVPCSLK